MRFRSIRLVRHIDRRLTRPAKHSGDEMMQRRVRIDYADRNDAFAAYLPRVGCVVGEFRDSNGVGPWYLLQLDDPFDYQLKVGEAFQFRLIHVDALLIRSRWEGCEVGGSGDVSVFVLLVEEGKHPSGGELVVKDYVHIAWGMCHREP